MRKFIFIASTFISSSAYAACDFCALHNSLILDGGEKGSITATASEQFTSFGRLHEDGRSTNNEGNQYLRNAITQIGVGAKITDDIAVQVNLPIINRFYRRIEDGEVRSGNVHGIGDTALIARWVPIREEGANCTSLVSLFGGLELPTGDASRLDEESSENGHAHGKHDGHYHGDEEELRSAIHGHDLAMGSGSLDYIVGANFFQRWDRLLAMGTVQAFLRTEGEAEYRYAHDLQWTFGPGVFFALEESYALAFRTVFTGEAKGRDVLNGNKENDTGRRNYYVGPELFMTAGSNLRAEFGADFPVDSDNTGVQVIPDYRLRLGVSYRF